MRLEFGFYTLRLFGYFYTKLKCVKQMLGLNILNIIFSLLNRIGFRFHKNSMIQFCIFLQIYFVDMTRTNSLNNLLGGDELLFGTGTESVYFLKQAIVKG